MKQTYKFPKRFLWGAATSAHQVEGGLHNQWTVWELENAKALAKTAEYKLTELPRWKEIKKEATNPTNYISGRATGHYKKFEEDFDIAASLNMNALRFSIEWSRIEPTEGVWDAKEIEHYRQYLMALRKRNIEPVVTLFHWSTPVWFAKKGGFEKHSNIQYFVRFAEKILDELGDYFRLVCTLNEPEVYVGYGWMSEGQWPPGKHGKYLLGAWVYRNLTSAHNHIVKLGRKKSRRFKFAVSKNCAHYQAGDTSFKTKLTIGVTQYVFDYWFFDRIKRSHDWVGLNYYFSHEYRDGKQVHRESPQNDLGWEMRPDDIEPVLLRLHKRYKKPIIVTESGVADRNDNFRQWWIAHSINAIHSATKKGVRVDGYLHWSLLDNSEWAYGKWPRFGLVQIDYKTLKRTIRPSAQWYGKVIKKMREG